MTVAGSIIEWLKKFSIDARKLSVIDTDVQSGEEDTYSLVKEPVQNVKTYISGKKCYTDHYMIQARLPSQYDGDRVNNLEFGEALEEWVSRKNHDGDFPDIPGASVQKISITTPFYMGRTETNNSIYRMTIAIQYEKEN
ncbi:MAG: hypothetical protein J1E83_12650 [Lachnospiraceae bacterium]|nr:hypothetical protein [Lachnospiraceae bacterium]